MLTWKFTADSQAILTCHEDGLVARWHGEDFQEMQPLFQLGSKVTEARISADGRMLAVGSTNGPIKVCDLERRVVVGEVGGPNRPNVPCAFLAQGKRLLAFSPRDLSVSEWDLPTGQKKQFWPSVATPRGTLSPGEHWWVTFERDGSVLIRNLVTGRNMRADLQVHQAFGGTFSPDGKLVAVASSLGFARLFDFDNNTLRETATLRGFLLGVNSVAFSSDGNRLATTSAGKEAIKLWDVASHQELLTLEGQVGTLWGADFSPDGRVLGATTEGGVLHLWRAPSWEEIAAAEGKAESKKL